MNVFLFGVGRCRRVVGIFFVLLIWMCVVSVYMCALFLFIREYRSVYIRYECIKTTVTTAAQSQIETERTRDADTATQEQ